MIKLHFHLLLILLILLTGCSSQSINQDQKAESPSIVYPEVTLDEQFKVIQGQTIYVPTYSSVFYENSDRTLSLTITLSIRNTDIEHSIIITEINYYDAQGNLLKGHLAKPIRLSPLASAIFPAQSSNLEGGSGENFLVKWVSENEVSQPIVEAVMISTVSTQGISFVSRGVAIAEKE